MIASNGNAAPAPMRQIPTDHYITLLESHIAVIEGRLKEANAANLSLHEINKALTEKLQAAEAASAVPATKPEV